jgi:hypothetical protein
MDNVQKHDICTMTRVQFLWSRILLAIIDGVNVQEIISSYFLRRPAYILKNVSD